MMFSMQRAREKLCIEKYSQCMVHPSVSVFRWAQIMKTLMSPRERFLFLTPDYKGPER
jgi:hypothetical protein